MIYLILIISLVLNVFLIIKNTRFHKVVNEYFCSDEDIEDMLDRL